MIKRVLRTVAGPLFVLVMLVGALWLLHKELQQYHWSDFLEGLSQIPAAHLWLAVALTAINYVLLVGYDILGVKYTGQALPLSKVALGSFLGYAVGNNFGTLFGGSTVRYRLYSSWGLSAIDVVRLVLIVGISFWIGVFALAGFVFVWEPLTIPSELHLPLSDTRPLGVFLLSLAAAYLALCAFRKTPVKIGNWEFDPPPISLSLMQYAVATVDLLVASGVLYVLLPESAAISFWRFLAAYLLALIASLVSQVPGGLGVLELVIIATLKPTAPHTVVGALLAYRLIYYLVPLAIGLLVLGGHEVSLHGKATKRTIGLLGKWTPAVVPRVMALSVFLSGAILLFSGATPPAAGRMSLIRHLLPLPLVEVSHFLGSIIGVMLLILARGLQRRIETAYYFTIALLAAGVAVTLLKGLDYEEAGFLILMLAVFVPCRRHFYRQGALLTERFTPRWMVAICAVIACTAWLMLFSFAHVDYQNDLWWRFAFSRDAPRSLRAISGVVIATLFAFTLRMVRAKGELGDLPSDRDIADAWKIVRQSTRTSSHLALLGDKQLLFNAERTAFIMYGREGQCYISLGDPVGADEPASDLAWEFRELCDVHGRTPVFYQVDDSRVAMYVEMGLSLIKIGEEARVPLGEFGLEGSHRKNLRRTHKQLLEAGCSFEIVYPPGVTELLPTLKAISDDWLNYRKTAEKGFSMGFFKPDYVDQCPVAIIRHEDHLVAFANLWLGANQEELSLDLMRYASNAPTGVMEFLFIQLMLWGKQNEYRWFNLGTAPLAGIESQPRAPLWNQFASLTYRYGGQFYNFQGLRNYKQKFDPVWTSKYIASPGGLGLPVQIANVATLISGGIRELVRK